MTLDDRELRRALALLADDRDPSADIAATVRARLRRKERVRRTVTIGLLVAAVVATITVASVVGGPGRPGPAPVGALPSSSATAPTLGSTAIPPASSGAPASQSADGTQPDPSTTPPGERIDQVFVSCYATPDLGDPDIHNHLGVTLGGGAGTATEALDMCKRFWTEGTLVGQPPYVLDQPSTPQNPVVPELTACGRAIPATPGEPEVPTREIVVLPGDPGICGQLGLDQPQE